MQPPLVARAVVGGVEGCLVYKHGTAGSVVRYLVELGNATNKDASGTTHWQVYRSTAQADVGWTRRAQAEHWTVRSLGQGDWESFRKLITTGKIEASERDGKTLYRTKSS